MAESRGFCPRCGDTLGPDEGIIPEHGRASRQSGLCPACYFADFALITVPETLTVHYCVSCGALKREAGWEDVDTEDLTEMAIEELTDALQIHHEATNVEWSVEPHHRGPNELDITCYVQATVHGEDIVEEETVKVSIAKETCTRCGRIAGDYYAATVQLRAADRDATEEEVEGTIEIAQNVVANRIEKGDRDAFITEIAERPEGVDIRVSSAAIGDQIATGVVERYGGSMSSSERLITEDGDGNRVYRVAFAIRLPAYTPGDILEVDDGEPVLIEGTTPPLRAVRLDTGDELRLEENELQAAQKIGERSEAAKATIVTIEDEHAVQILDPETYEPITIRRPAGLSAADDELSVMRTPAGIYPLPTDE